MSRGQLSEFNPVEGLLSANHRRVFEACYNTYFARLVFGLQQLHGSDGFDAEDIAHRAFEKLANRLGQTTIHNPEAFVWRVAQNFALQHKRGQAVRYRHAQQVADEPAAADSHHCTPERALLANEALVAINQSLLAMSERRRQIFLLHTIDGMNYTAIAAALGISRPAVAKHLAKAAAAIDRALAQSDQHDD